ncbi:MAG: hypothetical protein KC421_17605 [Anaerolineales bacterium]|nr:hypothetical protein [Anaerolineales bacterium]
MDLSRLLRFNYQHNWSRGFTRLFLTCLIFLLTACRSAALATNSKPTPIDRPGSTPPAEQPTPTAVSTATGTPSPFPTIPPTPTEKVADVTETAVSTPHPKATTPPTATPHADINGVYPADFIVLPPAAITRMQTVYARGQENWRVATRFSKLGDSITATPSFLTPFDQPSAYLLGDYDYLQPTIDHFAGSWQRYGVAIRAGLHAWSVFDPLWADKEWCEPNEDMLTCEIRLNNPAIMLVQLGSNDASPNFDIPLRDIVHTCMDAGVIPVLITKADRHEGDDNRNNEAVRLVAAEEDVPLLEFDLIADALPGRGLGEDDVHLTVPPNYDYTSPEVMTSGQAAQNLAILFMLDALREQVIAVGADS